jgi:hypothetical protein
MCQRQHACNRTVFSAIAVARHPASAMASLRRPPEVATCVRCECGSWSSRRFPMSVPRVSPSLTTTAVMRFKARRAGSDVSTFC